MKIKVSGVFAVCLGLNKSQAEAVLLAKLANSFGGEQ